MSNKVNQDAIEAELRLFKAFSVSEDYLTDSNSVNANYLYNRIASLLETGVTFDEEAMRMLKNVDQSYLITLTNAANKFYGINPDSLNSSFWKSISQVEKMSELEYRLNQFIHYASTYGLGYKGTAGQIYEPDALDENIRVDLERFTFITFLSIDELKQRIMSLLKSGVALSNQNQSDLLTLIDALGMKVDYEQIKNGEVQAALLSKVPAGEWPYNDFQLVTRALVYLVTDGDFNQVVKKDKQFRANLAKSLQTMAKDTYNKFQVVLANELNINWNYLVKYIRPYKKIYLIFKQEADYDNRHLINSLMRQNKKLHQPVKQNPLNHVRSLTDEQFQQVIKKAQTSKLLTILNYLSQQTADRAMVESHPVTYLIRNGKTWVKQQKNQGLDLFSLADKRKMALEELGKRYKNRFRSTQFVIPDFVHYALPTSQKQMVGAIPVGSSFRYYDHDLIIGINWHTKDLDLDLHAFTLTGDSFGWNEPFRDDNGLTYSGDMTNVNESGNAAEYFKIPKNLDEPIMLVVNNYNKRENATFDLLIDHYSENEFNSKGFEKQVIDSVSDQAVFTKGCQESLREQVLAIIVPGHRNQLSVFVTNCKLTHTQVSGADPLLHDFLVAKLGQYQTGFPFSNLITECWGNITRELTGAWQFVPSIEGKEVVVSETIDLSPMNLKQDTWAKLFSESEGDK